MNTREELDNFIVKADELITSSYILADVKIAGVLRAIAGSQTILAIFENCLLGFDFKEAKKKYLVKSTYLSEDRGEFVLPETTRELLAFAFYLLAEIDGKRIDLSSFINKYFYEDGSFSAGYASFIKQIIIPFKDSIKGLTESVLEGKLQNPLEALAEAEKAKAKQLEEDVRKAQEEDEISKKSYALNVKKIKEILLTDKIKIKTSNQKEEVKNEQLLVIDMLGSVITSGDRDAIDYAFIAYKYLVKAFPFRFLGRKNKVKKLLDGVINGLKWDNS